MVHIYRIHYSFIYIYMSRVCVQDLFKICALHIRRNQNQSIFFFKRSLLPPPISSLWSRTVLTGDNTAPIVYYNMYTCKITTRVEFVYIYIIYSGKDEFRQRGISDRVRPTCRLLLDSSRRLCISYTYKIPSDLGATAS